jgi:hypothetical protein
MGHQDDLASAVRPGVDAVSITEQRRSNHKDPAGMKIRARHKPRVLFHEIGRGPESRIVEFGAACGLVIAVELEKCGRRAKISECRQVLWCAGTKRHFSLTRDPFDQRCDGGH